MSYDHHSADYAESAEAIHQELRRSCPVAHSDAHGGFWVVTRYADVVAVSNDEATFSSEHDLTGEGTGFQGVAIPPPPVRMIPLEVDPPAFNAYRRLLNPWFAPAAVEQWDQYIRDLVTACLDRTIESGSIDLVLDLANPVPAIVTLAVLGMPTEDWSKYAEPMHTAVYAPPGTPEHDQAAADQLWIVGQLIDAVVDRQLAPRDDVLSSLATGRYEDGSQVSMEDAVAMAYTVMAGGVDTTTALIANALVWLSAHPDIRARVASSPGLIPSAREEMLRYFSPVQAFARTATVDTKIDGCPVDRGERVLLSFASANLDDAIFDDPEDVVIDRPNNRHVAFGAGIHRCLGRHFARHEIDVVLGEVLRRLPDYQVDASRVARYESIGNVNGLIRVPATFTPSARVGSPLATLIER
jgi:cytochrome P450